MESMSDAVDVRWGHLTPRSHYFVGATGFEPATPWSRTMCATRLRYAPMNKCESVKVRKSQTFKYSSIINRPCCSTPKNHRHEKMPITPNEAKVTRVAASNIPSVTHGRAYRKRIPKMKAATAPVQTPVPGNGMPTKIIKPRAS
jgi:hypothetical protein